MSTSCLYRYEAKMELEDTVGEGFIGWRLSHTSPQNADRSKPAPLPPLGGTCPND